MAAAIISRLKRVVMAPATWVAVWIIGTFAGILVNREWLASGCFLIAAPALLLILFIDMRRYEAPPTPAYVPPDRATRILMARNRRVLKDFALDRDATSHTLH